MSLGLFLGLFMLVPVGTGVLEDVGVTMVVKLVLGEPGVVPDVTADIGIDIVPKYDVFPVTSICLLVVIM